MTLTSAPPGRAAPPPARATPTRLVLYFLAAAASTRRLSVSARAIATISWQTVTAALFGVSAWDSLGMIAWGEAAYASPGYEIARSFPLGTRGLGVLLGVLLAYIAYGYGQHRLGRSTRLRSGLALLAGWHVGWLVMLAATAAAAWEPPSWRSLGVTAFVAFMATLAARATPPDHG